MTATVTSSFDDGEYTVEHEDTADDLIAITKTGYSPWFFYKEDLSTFIDVLIAYRDGFTFPPKPDASTDRHEAFPDR